MKKHFYFSVIFFSAVFSLSAQDFLPFASSNYAGITGVQLQPASIADSRYKLDLAFSSTSFSLANNYYGIDPYVITHPNLLQNLDFNGPYISRNNNSTDKSMIMSLRQDIISFMISLSPKASIAFTPSIRTIINIDNMSPSLALLLDGLNEETNLWNTQLKNENLNLQMNAWVEYGFTYARVLLDHKKHFLKGGVTLKLNQGLGSTYMFIKDLNYEVNGKDTVSFYNSRTNYGASDNLTDNFTYQFNTNPSMSFDLGFVYEFRPNWIKYKYDTDDETNVWRQDQDKYLLRLGFSMTDLGSIRYRRNPNSKDFNANIQNYTINGLNISSISDLNALIDSNFTYYNVPDHYNMNLPLCLSMQADVRLAKGLYINVTPYLALNRNNNNENKVHYLSAFNIVPRYDLKWFGVSFPFQYNAYKQWNMGIGLRIGPMWFGWNDLFSVFTSTQNRYGTSASVVFKLPLYYHKPHNMKETEQDQK